MREITEITCHHTASKPTTTPDEIRSWHVKGNGWSDIGYHWIVFLDEDGDWVAAEGRPESRAGAHAKNRNKHSIGIVVSGDYVEDTLPERAEIALSALVAAKCIQHSLTVENVFGHKEVMRPGYTECPGYDMDRIRDRVQTHLDAYVPHDGSLA
ncbi:MAG: peptidoglycan recognition family protein [Planctomycetota bacterium]|nr:peptidoglycan recognition family protein [Planctomycetota bacterium]